ncbi:MAG TPA: helix-hairpin-helix domain-containing protein [Terriglobales bacterium]|nr:helix-hairpin-helix domain-containing protein [Terriglobales bacterium]
MRPAAVVTLLMFLLIAALACQTQQRQVFAYRLPDAAVRPVATAAKSDPPRVNARARPLDLNHAAAAQLARVPGLSSALAAQIVAARPWRAKRDLLRRHLLTPAQYALAKAHLVVHRARPSRSGKPVRPPRRAG